MVTRARETARSDSAAPTAQSSSTHRPRSSHDRTPSLWALEQRLPPAPSPMRPKSTRGLAIGHLAYPRVIEHDRTGRAEGQKSSGPGAPAQRSPHPVRAAKHVRGLQHWRHHVAGWSAPRRSRALPPFERNYCRGHLSGLSYPHRVSEATGGVVEAAWPLPAASPAPRPGSRGPQHPASAASSSLGLPPSAQRRPPSS